MLLIGIFTATAPATEIKENNSMQNRHITLSIKSGKTYTATLADNSSARALIRLLEKSDISIEMQDNANMEKVGPLGSTLPRNDEQITTACGDLILYQGKYFVIYYAPNSWNFTRLGEIEDVNDDELKTSLGAGNVLVTISINKHNL